jgi:hypothetical protein
MSTFNIGSQNAGSIQNVGGDMVVHDGIHGTADVHVTELRGQLAHLSEEIDRLALAADSRALVKGALAEAAAPAPRSHRIEQGLRRVTEGLNEAGGLANAAVGVGRALARVVSLVALLA